MKLNNLGVIIARRRLCWPGKEGNKITVLIGKPRPFAQSKRFPNRDYYCPYQILGVGDQEIRYAGGVDAVQALQLVFTAIGADLRHINKRRSSTLRWLVEDQVLEGDKYFTNCGFPEMPKPSIATTIRRRFNKKY